MIAESAINTSVKLTVFVYNDSKDTLNTIGKNNIQFSDFNRSKMLEAVREIAKDYTDISVEKTPEKAFADQLDYDFSMVKDGKTFFGLINLAIEENIIEKVKDASLASSRATQPMSKIVESLKPLIGSGIAFDGKISVMSDIKLDEGTIVFSYYLVEDGVKGSKKHKYYGISSILNKLNAGWEWAYCTEQQADQLEKLLRDAETKIEELEEENIENEENDEYGNEKAIILVIDSFEGDIKLYKNYSGRGMHDKTCFGIVVNEGHQSLIDDFEKLNVKPKQDNLGKDVVLYWPQYTYENIISSADAGFINRYKSEASVAIAIELVKEEFKNAFSQWKQDGYPFPSEKYTSQLANKLSLDAKNLALHLKDLLRIKVNNPSLTIACSYDDFIEAYQYETNTLLKVLHSIDEESISNDQWDCIERKMKKYDSNMLETIQYWMSRKEISAREVALFAIENQNRFGTEPKQVVNAITDFLNCLVVVNTEESMATAGKMKQYMCSIFDALSDNDEALVKSLISGLSDNEIKYIWEYINANHEEIGLNTSNILTFKNVAKNSNVNLDKAAAAKTKTNKNGDILRKQQTIRGMKIQVWESADHSPIKYFFTVNSTKPIGDKVYTSIEKAWKAGVKDAESFDSGKYTITYSKTLASTSNSNFGFYGSAKALWKLNDIELAKLFKTAENILSDKLEIQEDIASAILDFKDGRWLAENMTKHIEEPATFEKIEKALPLAIDELKDDIKKSINDNDEDLKAYISEIKKAEASKLNDVKGQEPAAKDIQRMKDLKTKAGGDEEKMLKLAQNMANTLGVSPDSVDKAIRRAKAAEIVYPGQLGKKIAKIFMNISVYNKSAASVSKEDIVNIINNLSDGTLSILTGEKNCEKIEEIRAKWVEWQKSNSESNTWQESWNKYAAENNIKSAVVAYTDDCDVPDNYLDFLTSVNDIVKEKLGEKYDKEKVEEMIEDEVRDGACSVKGVAEYIIEVLTESTASKLDRANWWVGSDGVKKVAAFYNYKIRIADHDDIKSLPFGDLYYDYEEGLKFDNITNKKELEKYCEKMKSDLNLVKSEVEYF